MIKIGAGGGSRNRSLELRSPGSMLGLSPCPERSWRRVRLPACTGPAAAGERALNRRRWEGCGEFLIVSPLACTEPAAAPGSESHFTPPAVQNYSTHVPSNFRANLLKTNDWCTHKVTQKRGSSATVFQRSRFAVIVYFPLSISCTEAPPVAGTKCPSSARHSRISPLAARIG